MYIFIFLIITSGFSTSLVSESLNLKEKLPLFEEVKSKYQSSDIILLDRNGLVIEESRNDYQKRTFSWVKLDEISPFFIKAVLLAEDKNFYTHNGTDWQALGFGIFQSIFSGFTRGSSTITMQLVSLLDTSFKPKSKRRSILEKINQIKIAGKLESYWTKNQILETYLNFIYFRGELKGIHSAAGILFAKHPIGLTQSESLILASLIRSPQASQKMVKKRACKLLEKINSFHDGCKEIEKIELRNKNWLAPANNIALHAFRELVDKTNIPDKGNLIFSTIHKQIQFYAIERLQNKILELKNKNVSEGALLVVDNQTGEILAYVGNSGINMDTFEVNAVRARRQAGSTLKPFLYGIAFDKKYITPHTFLEDKPFHIQEFNGVYKPGNYQSDYHGLVTADIALASSLNVPAVRLIQMIGIAEMHQTLKKFGFLLSQPPEYYGNSLALGSLDVTLYELVRAYTILATEGRIQTLTLNFYSYQNIENANPSPFKNETFNMLTDILSDKDKRGLTFGIFSPLDTKIKTTVKTGTSKDMRDNWCIGYSNRFTVGVWVGNFNGDPMWNVSGITGAAHIWSEVMNFLHSRDQNIDNSTKSTSSIPEKKYESKMKIESTMNNAILYPTDGMIIALDPDIPIENQILFFKSSIKSKNQYWSLNDKTLGSTSEDIRIKPRVGFYRLIIRDDLGKVISKVLFQVR